MGSYGAKGYCATSAKHFEELLRQCVNEGGVKVLEVPIDYEWANSLLDEELPRAMAAAHPQTASVRDNSLSNCGQCLSSSPLLICPPPTPTSGDFNKTS